MVSVITATFNRAEQLKRGMGTILRQEVLPDEIVIVDDGSVDNTKDVVNELKSRQLSKPVEWKYIYLDHPEARISCHAHNVGIQKAAGDILIFTEPELLHVNNTIEQLLQKMKEHPTSVPVVTYMYTMGDRVYKSLNQQYFDDPNRILSHEYAAVAVGNQQNTKAPDSDWAITGSYDCFNGSLFAVRKEWLMEIGGYDEEFTGHGWDDWDLLHRLDAADHPHLNCNDICVIHQWHKKDYPYNIYDHAERNGKISEERLKRGDVIVNKNKLWGDISG